MIYQEFLAHVLKKASTIATGQFGKVSSIEKTGDNNQVLTHTDLEVGKLLVSSVQEKFPTHNIIDEEAGVIDNNSSFTWVIDPIDGTSNFANGLPTYGIMIGLLEHATPIAGGIALPAFNQIYTAEKGFGTWIDGKKVTVTQETQLLKTLVAYGIDGHQENPSLTYNESKIIAEIVLHIRNLRSSNSAFDIIQVATGRYGGSLAQSSKIWDNVAPHIIIEEAGGVYTDFFGKPMDYSNPLAKVHDNFTLCAASPTLQKQLQKIVISTNK